MSEVPERPLAEVVRRWETPFERDPVDLDSLSYDPATDVLTLILVRRADERAFKMIFRDVYDFRIMDEIGWAGEFDIEELGGLYDEPIIKGRALTTLIVSAGALRFSAWPQIVFQASGRPDWIYVIWTGWDCVEIVATAPPEIGPG
jgi:hypothetical protein